jgi:2-(1,2-epoxy-1,2-dihydrophenyl)acetyl-CoA isomerase
MTQSVLVDVTDGVAHLTLNRPDNANSLDLPLATAPLEALESGADDPEVRVVLLTGNGKICCGGDVGAMAAAPARGALVAELARVAHTMVRRLCSIGQDGGDGRAGVRSGSRPLLGLV